MTNELSRSIPRSKVRPEGLTVVVRANDAECAAVAARMGIPAIRSLECLFNLSVNDGGEAIFAEGGLRAEVTRICVTSLEEFETSVDEEFELRFVPAGTEREDPDPDLPDEIPYAGDTIDLGEAAAEQLGLALDPYPRMEGATVPESDGDQETSPFAVLARRMGPDRTRQ